MRILVLYWYPPGLELRPAVERHLRALDGYEDRLVYHNAAHGSPPGLARIRPDAVLLHTTFLCLRWFEDFPRHRRRFSWLAGLDCPKLAVPQDEYDHSDLLDEWLAELGATHVFTNFGQETRSTLYPRLAGEAEFCEVLTGYVDESAAETLSGATVPLAERPHDIVYRASQLPYWFGSHGQLKHRLGAVVAERAKAHGLSTDISTRAEDTILGAPWWEFLGSGRVVIGCESGSSVLDPRGELQARIRRMLAVEPSLSFDEVADRLPPGWDSWSFFAISPRHLEAVLTRTCQVLVEGSYSGVLEPNRQYIPLRRDLADLDEVLERIRDVALLECVADQAYEDIVESGRYSYAAFAVRLRADLPPEPAGGRRTSKRAALAVALTLASGSARLRQASPAISLGAVLRLRVLVLALARRPRVRQLVRVYVVRRPAVPVLRFLEDLVRLEALRRDAAVANASLDVRDGTAAAVVITTPETEPFEQSTDVELAAALRQGAAIVWLHGPGEGGFHRFEALADLGRSHPEVIARALAEATGALPGPLPTGHS